MLLYKMIAHFQSLKLSLIHEDVTKPLLIFNIFEFGKNPTGKLLIFNIFELCISHNFLLSYSSFTNRTKTFNKLYTLWIKVTLNDQYSKSVYTRLIGNSSLLFFLIIKTALEFRNFTIHCIGRQNKEC